MTNQKHLRNCLGVDAMRPSSKNGFFKGLLLTVLFLLASTSAMMAQATATSQVTLYSGFTNGIGVAVDGFSNLYTTDASGSLYQFTGANGAPTQLLSGLGTIAQVAVDTSRTLYVATGTSNVVNVYTYTSGAFNLNKPTTLGTSLGKVTGVAVDISGNVYIVDNTAKSVVKIASGVQSTIISGLSDPRQVAVDIAGNVYVADAGTSKIVSLAAGATTTTSIGTGLNAPNGVAVDVAQNLYIADTGNSKVWKIPYSTTTSSLTTASQADLGVSFASGQGAPQSVAVDTLGTVYVATASSAIRYSAGNGIFFGQVTVGATGIVTPVTVTFAASVTPSVFKVVTWGQTGKDYNDAVTGTTCVAGQTYAAGTSCVVSVTLTPIYAGPRAGAIVFYSSANKVLARIFLGGGGSGPVMAFDYTSGQNSAIDTPTVNSLRVTNAFGLKTDGFGNIFFNDYKNGRIVELPSDGTAATAPIASGVGAQDVAIDGAGDILIPAYSTSGAVTVYPYENGSWSTVNAAKINGKGSALVTLNTPRTVNVDVMGNAYSCDGKATSSVAYIYKMPIANALTPTAMSYTSIKTTGCSGVAVDLMGNVAYTTGGTNAYYIPASGKATYTAASGFTYSWGIGFDASGSLFAGDYYTTKLYRIPNENGTLNSTDMYTLGANKSYGFALDPNGNVIIAPYYGSNTMIQYNVVSRSKATIAFSGTTAVGSYATPVVVTVTNSGSAAPQYQTSTGLNTTGNWGQCDFTGSVAPGTTCYLPTTFQPTTPGLARSETVTIPTQSPYYPTLILTGTSAGTATTTSPGLSISAVTPASPKPTQAITVTVSTVAQNSTTVTGAVSLSIDGTTTLYASTDLASGTATFTISAGLTKGAHQLYVTYAGDSNYAAVTTPIEKDITVSPVTSSLALDTSLDANNSQTAYLIAKIATESGMATPTGTVTFLDGGAAISSCPSAVSLSSGVATCTVNYTAAGTHKYTYTYTGDNIYGAATSSESDLVIGTYTSSTTAIVLSPVVPTGGYVYGNAVTVTATVTPSSGTKTPTGSVIFVLGGDVTEVPMTSGAASATFTPVVGAATLNVYYTGDSTYAESTASKSFAVIQATTATKLTYTAQSVYAGSPMTLTATVTSTTTSPNSGTVTFWNGATYLGSGTLSTSGVASLTTTAVIAGTARLYAVYSGNSNCATSTSSTTQVAVLINPTTVSVNSLPVVIYLNTTADMTVTVGYSAPKGSVRIPTGTLSLYINGTLYQTASSNSGVYKFTSVTGLSDGINSLTGSYSGDNYYGASTSTAYYTVYQQPSNGSWDGSYSIAVNPSSISTTVGTAVSATFTLTPSSNYFGYVSVTCAGLPDNTNCVTPSGVLTLDGTNTAVSSTLTIYSLSANQMASNQKRERMITVCGLSIAPIVLLAFAGCFRRGRVVMNRVGASKLAMVILLLAGLGAMNGCGSHIPVQTVKGTYSVTLTATGSGGVNSTIPLKVTFK